MKQRILLLFALILSLTLLAACSSGGEVDPGPVKDSANALIGEDGTTPYVLIRPDDKDQNASDAMTTLAEKLEEQTGIKFKLGTDFVKAGTQFVEGEYEILIGDTNREASKTIGTELPRVRDWAIARIGSKIVIQGKNSLHEAVAYFLENYVADGNIYIADGEKHVHTGTYEIDTLTVGGVSINEFTVYYDRTSAASEAAAKHFISYIRETVGYVLETGSRIPEKPEKAIIFAQSPDANNYLEHRIYLDGTAIRLESGTLVNPEEAADALSSHIGIAKTALDVVVGECG